MKSWFYSRTVWFNVLSGLTLFFALPELTAVLPQGAMPWLLLAQAAINIVLRFMSTTTVVVSSPEKE